MNERIDSLALFVAIVDTGSLTAAAHKLGVSLSSVSRHLTALEERVGIRLLVRSTRQLMLTDAGHSYYASAKRLMTEIGDVERNLTSTAAQPAGRISITSTTLFGRVHLMPLLAEFLIRYPQVTLDVTMLDRPVNLLEEGIDLAIAIGELKDSSLICRSLGSVRWVFAASPAYLSAHGTPTDIKDLSLHDCLIYSQQNYTDEWIVSKNNHDVRMQVPVKIRSNSIDAIVSAATYGTGIALAPAWSLASLVKEKKLVHILPDYQTQARPIQAVFTHHHLLANKIRILLDFLVAKLSGASFEITD